MSFSAKIFDTVSKEKCHYHAEQFNEMPETLYFVCNILIFFYMEFVEKTKCLKGPTIPVSNKK